MRKTRSNANDSISQQKHTVAYFLGSCVLAVQQYAGDPCVWLKGLSHLPFFTAKSLHAAATIAKAKS